MKKYFEYHKDSVEKNLKNFINLMDLINVFRC